MRERVSDELNFYDNEIKINFKFIQIGRRRWRLSRSQISLWPILRLVIGKIWFNPGLSLATQPLL